MVRDTATAADVQAFGALAIERPIAIPTGTDFLTGSMAVPASPSAVALMAHDTGCSRQRSCERDLARALRRGGLATVLVDVVTPLEQAWPEVAAGLRQDVELVAKRIEAAREWIRRQVSLAGLPVVLVGSSGAGAACLLAAAARPEQLAAVVVRSARPDLAGFALGRIKTPVMLCVAEGRVADGLTNRAAFDLLGCDRKLLSVRGRSLEAPEACAQVAAAVIAFVRSWLPVRRAA
jgi:putative phosphoribosyl transferase